MPETDTTAADTIAVAIPLLQRLAAGALAAPGTPPATAAAIKTALATVQTGVSALAESTTAAESTPIVDIIESSGKALLATAAGLPLPFPFNIILMAAAALLPSVIATVKLLMAHKITVPAPV
jgi:hypothetical protein